MDHCGLNHWKYETEDTVHSDFYVTGGISEKVNSPCHQSNFPNSVDCSAWSDTESASSRAHCNCGIPIDNIDDFSHCENCDYHKPSTINQYPMTSTMNYTDKFYHQQYRSSDGQIPYYDSNSPFNTIPADDNFYHTEKSYTGGYSLSENTSNIKSQDTCNINKNSSHSYKKIGTYLIERTIGKGNFSVVKLATHTLTHLKVAIKIIDKTRLNEENLKKMYREVQIMKKLNHPNIVKMYQVMETPKLLYIVMEYIPNGEVFEHIAAHGRFSEAEARVKFAQILSAVEHCHGNQIVHRDLKAENLLLDQNMNIKLADFGFGTFFEGGDLLSTWCGSPPYAAPEIFKGDKYVGPKSDVWSLGVVLYVLVCGALPFDEQTLPRLRDQVLTGWFRVPYWMSDSCEQLIRGMLNRYPNKRFSIARIKDHKWIQAGPDLPQEVSSPVHEVPTANCSQCPGSTSAQPEGSQRQRVSISERDQPSFTEENKESEYNELVIQMLEHSGMSRQKMIESLDRGAYDHLTAAYLLCVERLRQHRQSVPAPTPTSYEQVMRRPSSLAEQAILHPPVTQAKNLPQHRYSLQAGGGVGPTVGTTASISTPPNADSLQLYLQNMHLREDVATAGVTPEMAAVSRRVSAQSYATTSSIVGTSIDEGVEFDLSASDDGNTIPCDEPGGGATSTTPVGNIPPGASASASLCGYTLPSSVATSAQQRGRVDSFDSAMSVTSVSSGRQYPLATTPFTGAIVVARPQRHSLGGTAANCLLGSPQASLATGYFIGHGEVGVETKVCTEAGASLCPPPHFKEGRRASDGGSGASMSTNPPQDTAAFPHSLRQTGRTGGVLELGPAGDPSPPPPPPATRTSTCIQPQHQHFVLACGSPECKTWTPSRVIRGRGVHYRQHGAYRRLPSIPSNEGMEEQHPQARGPAALLSTSSLAILPSQFPHPEALISWQAPLLGRPANTVNQQTYIHHPSGNH